MSVDEEAVHSREARLAVEAARNEYEPCHRVLEARAAEWVRSGRSPSRLLEADELRVVRRWLGEECARALRASDEIQRLVSSSEAALAAPLSAARQGKVRRLGRWLMVAFTLLIGAAAAEMHYFVTLG
jgi:hypothetical protein